MNDGLRQRLADVLVSQLDGYSPAYLLDYGCVTAIFDEIAAAGYVVIERERVERLIAGVLQDQQCHDCIHQNGLLIEPGDLEPLP